MTADQKRIFQYLLSASLFLITTIMVGIVIAVFQSRTQVRIDNYRIIETHLIKMLSNAREAESAQRGYLLTRDVKYLSPYEVSKTRTFSELRQIRNNSHATKLEALPIAKIRELLELKFDEMQMTIALFVGGRIETAVDLVKTDEGERIMQELQTLVYKELKAIDTEIADQLQRSATISLFYTIARILIVLSIIYLLYVIYSIVSPIINRLSTANQQMILQEVDLKEKNRQLEHFAFITSHDLREPLRTIKNFVEIIEEELSTKGSETILTYFNYVVDGVNRMDGMIIGLLAYSRLGQSRSKEEIDLNILIRHTMSDIQMRVGEVRADLRVGTLPTVIGYRQELGQLFQNLILNAIKFIPDDRIPHIGINVKEEPTQWAFVVSDNGIGIEERLRERIFNIFYKAHLKSEYGGQGLGLAFCKKIVELHDGKIWVESEMGEGSQFHFTISKDADWTLEM
ncbi:MAG: ATP-binding protein [Bacteroidota bacterium]